MQQTSTYKEQRRRDRSFRLNKLTVMIFVAAMCTTANTATPTTTATPTATTTPLPAGTKVQMPSGDTGRPAGLADLIDPQQNDPHVSSRYGVRRPTKKGALGVSAKYPRTRSHNGLDMVEASGRKGNPLYATTAGKVVSTHSVSGNTVRIQRSENADIYQYMHMRSPTPVSVGQQIATGQKIGTEGNTGLGDNGAVHLHFDYAIRQSESPRLRNAWLGAENNPLNTELIRANGNAVNTNGVAYVPVDPTPYLRRDFKISDGRPILQKALGNTLRGQFNKLYGTNLPIGAGGRTGSAEYGGSKSILPENTAPLTDAQIAAAGLSSLEAVQVAVEQGRITETQAAQLMGTVTPKTMATIFGDTDSYGSPQLEGLDIGVSSMSPRQMIDHIATSRYGNEEWMKRSVQLSSRGLLIEFTNMNAASNYLQREIMSGRERIEGLLATYTKLKNDPNNKFVSLLYASAQSQVIPDAIDIDLENITPELYKVYGLQDNPCNGNAVLAQGSVSNNMTAGTVAAGSVDEQINKLKAAGITVTKEMIDGIKIGSRIRDYDQLFVHYGNLYGVRPELLKAQAYTESGLKVTAFNAGSKAFGLTQFIPSTAREYGVVQNDAESQVRGQAKYMKKLLRMWDRNESLALASYNWGEGKVQRNLPQPREQNLSMAPTETRKYIQRILPLAEAYKSHFGGGQPTALPSMAGVTVPLANCAPTN